MKELKKNYSKMIGLNKSLINKVQAVEKENKYLYKELKKKNIIIYKLKDTEEINKNLICAVAKVLEVDIG